MDLGELRKPYYNCHAILNVWMIRFSKKKAYAFTLTLYLASSMASAFVMELTAPWNKKMK
jgi:hypothetical protein